MEAPTNFCECGCGQIAKNRFVTHHNVRRFSEETKEKMRLSAQGRIHPKGGYPLAGIDITYPLAGVDTQYPLAGQSVQYPLVGVDVQYPLAGIERTYP